MSGGVMRDEPDPAADDIRAAAGAADIAVVRALFAAYAGALGVSLCFQGFDDELASLPGAYAAPRGGLWLAGPRASPLGCVALRPLPYGAAGDAAELKRLYVTSQARGTGLGRRLALQAIGCARSAGYREVKLDTLDSMHAARALYRSLGFEPCEAYYDNPLGGTLYMSLTL